MADEIKGLVQVITTGSQVDEAKKPIDLVEYDALRASASPSTSNPLATLADITAVVTSLSWQDPVKDKDLATPPGSPVTGDRYVVATGGTGAWLGKDDQIAEWDGTSWVFTIPLEGFALWVEDEDKYYTFNGTSWVKLGTVINHQNLIGAGTNTHAQIDTHVADISNPHVVTKSQVGLGNVTDDAQLKRAAADINSFTEKVTPVDADVILIEDSAAAFAKKKVLNKHLAGMGTYSLDWEFGRIRDGLNYVAGVYEQVITTTDVDAVTNPTMVNMNRFNVLVNVTTITSAGTLRITGTSYNPATGTTTPSDTEDIVIGAGNTGYYVSSKLWEGTITLSDVSGLDIVVDGYRFKGHGELLLNATLDKIIYSGKPKAGEPSSSLQVEIFKFDPVARTFTNIFDVTQTPAQDTTIHNERYPSVSFDFADGERLFIRITVAEIDGLQLNLGFTR